MGGLDDDDGLVSSPSLGFMPVADRQFFFILCVFALSSHSHQCTFIFSIVPLYYILVIIS